jgi:cytochrome c biogenesis protein CcmG/thiol:disulfide interchange protein DsbE
MKKLMVVVVLVGGVLLYTYMARKNLDGQIETPAAQESLLSRLPNSSFVTLENQHYPLGRIAEKDQSQIILVHFWATWCGPCEAELPELLRFVERLEGKQKVSVVLVAVNDEVPKILKFLKTLPPVDVKIDWVLDNTSVHRDAFGTTKLPESYLFAADGQLLRKLVGPQEWEKPLFFDMFASYLR